MKFYVDGHEPKANQVRPIQLQDLAWAMRLEDEAFAEHERWEPMNYLEFLERGGNALVATHYRVPVGVLWYEPEDNDTTCGFSGLAVQKEYRNNGFATMLIKEALRVASDEGYDRACLQVREDNPAQNLYRRLGFEDFRVEDGYYSDGTSAIHMTRSLRT